MVNVANIRDREVINIRDGTKIGVVYDMEIDFEQGKIVSIIIPNTEKFTSIFRKSNDIIIPWNYIKKIGTDVILVELDDDQQISSEIVK